MTTETNKAKWTDGEYRRFLALPFGFTLEVVDNQDGSWSAYFEMAPGSYPLLTLPTEERARLSAECAVRSIMHQVIAAIPDLTPDPSSHE